jgi:YgiT-type zinc finger domain-containing protein
MEPIVCFVCGKETTKKSAEIRTVHGNYELILSGVTVFTCESCGETLIFVDEAMLLQTLTETLEQAYIDLID